MRGFARRVSAVAAVFAVAMGALAAGIAACSHAYGGDADASSADATNEPKVTFGDDAALPDPCEHIGPPAAPAADDTNDELPTFFMAIENIQLGAGDAGATQGFDLDGVCTCDTRPGTAFDGGPACKAPSATPACDLDGGIDNAVSVLTAELSPFYAIDSIAQHLITSGRRTLLIQVGKYNGQLNDREVAIGLAMSDGIRAQPACDASVENTANGFWSPCWDGDDSWSLLSEAVIPNTTQPFIQTLGYVANGVLVVHAPSKVTVPFNEAQSLTVGSTVLSGSLVPLGDDLKPRARDQAPATEREKRLWMIENATYGGRVSASSLLEALGTIAVPHEGGANTYLCQEALFPTLRDGVCGARDIPSNSDLDRNLDTTCNALSLAMHVSALPAVAGNVRVGDPSTTPCTPSPTGGVDGGMPYVCP